MKPIYPFSFLALLLTCTLADHEDYLFVEIEHDYISKLTQTNGACSHLNVDRPMYLYNSLNGDLYILHVFNMTDSTKYLIGTKNCFYGDIASGAGAGVSQFCRDTLLDTMQIEYFNKKEILKIYFNENGFINVNFNDSIFVLLNVKDSLLIHENIDYQRDSSSCSYEIIHNLIIRNQGYINSNNIKYHY